MSTSIKASGLRPGDSLLASKGQDHRNKRLRVTRVERGGVVRVFGTRKGTEKESLLAALSGNAKVTINRTEG